MSREDRDFFHRPAEEQQAFLENTWCDVCMEPDLGMTDPQEYQVDGSLFIEGKCKQCKGVVVTELSDEAF